MVVLITCKNEEYPIKNDGTRVVKAFNIDFFRHSMTANSVVGSGMWTKFELIQAFMVLLVTCKKVKNPFNNEGTRLVETFLPL